jgi:hypothetical protein
MNWREEVNGDEVRAARRRTVLAFEAQTALQFTALVGS